MYDYESIFVSFCSGDVDPFYASLYPGLLIYASRQLGSELSYLAEDCVQEAIMNSYRMRKSFSCASAWYSYLLKCVLNSALQHLRKNNSRSRYFMSEEPDATLPDPDVDILEQEVLDTLYNAIKELPDKYQELLRMSYVEGLKNAEIAARLGVAEITVKKQKARLLAILREKMDGMSPAVISLLLTLCLQEQP